MKKFNFLRTASVALLAQAAWAASPWLPEGGKASVTELFVYDTFRNYRPGGLKATLPAPYIQRTWYTLLEYGVSNSLSFEMETGRTQTFHRANGLSGITDTTLGVRYQALRGESWVMTFRGAAIIKGTYPIARNANFSPGDGASGFLGSAIYGRALPKGFFTFTEVGFRHRQNPVPADFFGTTGIGSGFKRVSWTTSYQTARSINGTDIRGGPPTWGPYFNPSMFPATKKIFGAMDFGGNFYVGKGLSLTGNYSHFLHGRNVGLKSVIAVGVGFNLPGKGPHFE
jgi:hypothetical protein